MLSILGERAPFEVASAVVLLVAVFVVDALSVIWTLKEYGGDDLMDKSPVQPSKFAQINFVVAPGVKNRRKKGSFPASLVFFSGFAYAAYKSVNRSDLTKIGCFVKPFKAGDCLPDFLHSSLHQREVITEGARQGGDESPFRPLKLAAQGIF